jgi:hypothetical protein
MRKDRPPSMLVALRVLARRVLALLRWLVAVARARLKGRASWLTG